MGYVKYSEALRETTDTDYPTVSFRCLMFCFAVNLHAPLKISATVVSVQWHSWAVFRRMEVY